MDRETMSDLLRVGVSGDFRAEAPGLLEPVLDEVLGPFTFIQRQFFTPRSKVVAADELRGYDAVITLKPYYADSSFVDNDQLAIIARWGAGYDMIDVPACTRADVLLAITPDSVRKPVAEGIMAFFLALAKNLLARDRITRTAAHDLAMANCGFGLCGKTFGSVGLGNIAAEMFRLLKPFGPGRLLAHDPYADREQAGRLGVQLVDLPTLFRESDFLAVNCLLNEETRGMIDAPLLTLMKPTAYFVNAARGGIVKEDDLVAVLQGKGIAGAGLDVFEHEPLPADHPLTRLDNVILTPHRIAWSDALYRGNGVGACQNVLAILRGKVPEHTVNREVAQQPGFHSKLRSLGKRWAVLAARH